jgi:DNA modification methylase
LTAPIPNREIRVGDCRALLRDLPDESVNCVVTSPPYWGLRDYGVDGQLGLEATPEEYVALMVEVFSDIRRVLRADGTLWLNLGDSYVSAPPGNKREDLARSRDVKGPARRRRAWNAGAASIHPTRGARGDRLANGHGKMTARKTFRRDGAAVGGPAHLSAPDLKLKDKVGIPWRVAFALQAEGWYLRSDIIWAKPNPMPEAVLDRPTSAHEYVFLFSKSPRYFYDAKAIREPVTGRSHPRGDGVNPKAGPKDDARNDQGLKTSTRFGRGDGFRAGKNETSNGVLGEHRTRAGFNERWRTKQNASFSGAVTELVDERNKRSVWTIATEPYARAHFATFPKKLVEPCILAGCPPGGLVLDPFGGSGTVGEVAEVLGRRWILLELNPAYAEMARARTAQLGLFGDAAASVSAENRGVGWGGGLHCDPVPDHPTRGPRVRG